MRKCIVLSSGVAFSSYPVLTKCCNCPFLMDHKKGELGNWHDTIELS